MDYSNLFVCLMGLGTVFFGLICIIALTYAMSALCRKANGSTQAAPSAESAPAAVPAPAEPNRQEMLAAVSAALAENLGTDISGIRILSFRKLDGSKN
ncbi:MAG: OadG family protein [Oscillibacter sp.]|jgi:sodium pump decarboxylase gamma subunit|nr:OadG family protein [Oscillibacter sp.]